MAQPVAIVITASTRAAAGLYADESGAILVAGLRQQGFSTADAIVVADGEPLARALAHAVAGQPAVVITTGGTGLAPTDRTPEATAALIDREVPGIAEALRAAAIAHGVPTGMLSRGIAGVAGTVLVINVAGSAGAARDALAVLAPVLGHAVEQLRGGDHGPVA
jgi:molybdenum cofactor synthesis domain-containing protein